ncbi:unnamed protein product [Sphagnum jensenii]|uniref:Endonuclease/exonuclease/phosphatase domain-containing protein n=1 Tax=Sphagnum jensenii TaxID=128206 RepID=A0ABP1B6P5_9BRYO
MMVAAYEPIDVFDASVKDTFHLFMFSYLKVVPPTNKVVVLGDFNVKLGCSWESSSCVMGRHHLHHDEASLLVVSHGNRDHRLLGATLQPYLQVPPWAATFGGVWDAVVLWDMP